MKEYLLKIPVLEIKGTCSIYEKGNSFLIENGYILNTKSIIFEIKIKEDNEK